MQTPAQAGPRGSMLKPRLALRLTLLTPQATPVFSTQRATDPSVTEFLESKKASKDAVPSIRSED